MRIWKTENRRQKTEDSRIKSRGTSNETRATATIAAVTTGKGTGAIATIELFGKDA